MQETRHWDEDAGATQAHALEGGGVRLPLLPRARPPAARARPPRGSRGSRADLPELPAARRARYEAELGLQARASRRCWSPTGRARRSLLRGDRRARRRCRAAPRTGSRRTSPACVNTAPVGPTPRRSRPPHIADLIRLVADGDVSGAGAKQALEEAFETGDAVEDIVERPRACGRSATPAALEAWVADEAIAENPGPVEQFRGGKEGALGRRPRPGDEEVRWLGQPQARRSELLRAAPVRVLRPAAGEGRPEARRDATPGGSSSCSGSWRLVEALCRPLGRMWRSEDPLDAYGLAHFGSVAGDALVAIALADSIFFDIPPVDAGEGQGGGCSSPSRSRRSRSRARSSCRCSTARDPRRAISFGAALGPGRRLPSTPRLGSARCCCSRCAFAAPGALEGARDHEERPRRRVRGPDEGLVRANARLGRIGRAARCSAAGPAFAAPEALRRRRGRPVPGGRRVRGSPRC